jgi:hypothetical protein
VIRDDNRKHQREIYFLKCQNKSLNYKFYIKKGNKYLRNVDLMTKLAKEKFDLVAFTGKRFTKVIPNLSARTSITLYRSKRPIANPNKYYSGPQDYMRFFQICVNEDPKKPSKFYLFTEQDLQNNLKRTKKLKATKLTKFMRIG